MKQNNDNNNGCFTSLFYILGAIGVLLIIGGAMEGIGRILESIPWYLMIFISLGLIFLLSKIFKW
mgnify:CR=1 FL=1|tara:strand:- start:48927 stop:49121 length:195 start_codon:yes stop_codon:yes gene_type:complete